MARIRISPWLPAVLCLLFRFLPAGAFLPFLAAVVIHELAHAAVLMACGVPIRSIELAPMRLRITPGLMSWQHEAVSALAGPCASFLLLLLWLRWPWLAFWGLMQGLYNLLPIYPLDGGRAMKAVLSCLLPQDRVWAIVRLLRQLTGIFLAGAVLLHPAGRMRILGILLLLRLLWGK